MNQIGEGIWCYDSHLKLFGNEFGIRMTILLLPGEKDLMVISPINPTKAIFDEVEKLGNVKIILCPNLFHHLFAQKWKEQYPNSTVIGPRGLAKKRPTLNFKALAECSENEFGNKIRWEPLQGIPWVNEVVVYHIPSKTLVVTDLIFNIVEEDNKFFRWFWKIYGVFGKPSMSKFYKMGVRDREGFKVSISKILSWDIDQLVMAHGSIISEGAKEKLESALGKYAN